MPSSSALSHQKSSVPRQATLKSIVPTTKFKETPILKAIPRSHKKRAVSRKMATGFPILDLPDELRLKIYGFILPSNERIFLDPENFYRPLPYHRESYGDTFSLLRVNKKIHYEATEFIFTNNIVNIIKPKKADDFLADLGDVACQFITKLECHMQRDLGDLGRIWHTMSNCPKLEELRLVFYHDRQHWHYLATQLAHKAMKTDDFFFELELYDSIWATSWYGYERDAFLSVNEASIHAQVYSFAIPAPVKKIVVTASISHEVTVHLLASNGGNDWELRRVGRQQNGEINTLRWIGTEIGEDVELDNDDGY